MLIIPNVSLDLSFNRIEKIEGLESLGKLQLMNLNHNRISFLENMDTLKELTNFSIAGNGVEELDNVTKFICKHYLHCKYCISSLFQISDYNIPDCFHK